MQANRDKVLAALTRHIGRDNGVRVAALALRVGMPARQVRSAVTVLRKDGVAVCGTPTHGYYIAGNAEELEETCRFLRGRALHSLTLESRLRNVPLADLVGQLHLPT